MLIGDPRHIRCYRQTAFLAGSAVLCCSGSDPGGRLAVIQPPGTQAITMLSAEKEAHCRRMLEHLTEMAASGQRSAAPTRTDPQFAIRLVGEVRRNEAEPRRTRRRRRRGEDAVQSDLHGL